MARTLLDSAAVASERPYDLLICVKFKCLRNLLAPVIAVANGETFVAFENLEKLKSQLWLSSEALCPVVAECGDSDHATIAYPLLSKWREENDAG